MKKGKVKILTYFIMLVMLVFSLAGCKSKETGKTDVTPAVTKTPTAVPEMTALEVAKLMGNGINLGNTMEAYGHKILGINADVSKYETFWGQPVTTQEMINAMKASGFDTLRIPVAWTNAMDFENGNYAIGEAYLKRVEEIVKYALNADMYVIVNDHWDGGWWGMFGSATQAKRDAAMIMYRSMWTQIAERFKDYPDHLILESGNEEIGNRLNDKDFAPDSGTLTEDDCFAMNTKINQAFVDVVRGTGGRNAKRFLLIAGYDTGIDRVIDKRFVMPTDTVKDKLLLSVHYYTPFGYTGNTSLSSWGTEKNYKEMNDNLAKMQKFKDQGIGVVFGEYQVALNKDGSIKDNASEFYTNFLDNCDKYGYVPVLWDTNTTFNKTKLALADEVAPIFKNRSLSAQASLTDEEIVANATKSMDKAYAAAVENDKAIAKANEIPADKARAWLMYNSGDWSIMYSVGDVYDPTAKTDGLVPTDVDITGAGTYTVGLDFTGTGAGVANGVVFSAVGIGHGETLFPGYIITIKDIKVNGKSIALTGKPYTTADDDICTRVNLYNSWVTTIPDKARTADGNVSDVSANIIDPAALKDVKTLTVTFDYGPAK